MSRRDRGEITVFLSLILLLVFSLMASLVESVRVQSVRMQLETAGDASILSEFAAYSRVLYEDYDVFFFDGSYGNTNLSESVIQEHLHKGMEYNLNPKKDISLSNTNLLQITHTFTNIEQMALATDDQGAVFRESAVEYMKNKYGLDIVESLYEQYEWIKSADEQGQQYEAQENENANTLNLLEEEKAKVDEENQEDAKEASKKENPAAGVSEKKALGVLNLVCKDTTKISQNSVDLSMLPSGRILNSGTGIVSYQNGLPEEILFQMYLMEKFPNALSEDTDTSNNLHYQLEYLLMGKEHDVENLKGTINRLLFIREGVNFVYLLTDTQKMAEAETIALALVGYTGIPPLVTATKYVLLLSWAYAESIQDVKSLLAGGKVALLKTAANWKTSLENIGKEEVLTKGDDGEEKGLSYQDYLRLLLFISNKEEVRMRMLDLVEINIRNTEGNQNLKVDHCVYMLEVSMGADTRSILSGLSFMRKYSYAFEKSYQIKKQFRYDMR